MDSLQFTVPAEPGLQDDGTITAIVEGVERSAGGGFTLTVSLPASLPTDRLAGRYFMARCGAQSDWERANLWTIYLRRPLYVIGHRPVPAGRPTAEWQLWLPDDEDAGNLWLRTLQRESPVNLIGPQGNGFALLPTTRNLLLVAEAQAAPLLLTQATPVLDRGGRATLLVVGGSEDRQDLLASLPLAMEVLQAQDGEELQRALAQMLPWADQLFAALDPALHPDLAEAIRRHRLRLEPGFALMLIRADLACSTGACLACVVPLANGSLTRACVHGPVFDLLELVGRT